MRISRSLCIGFVTVLCSLCAVDSAHAQKRPTVAGELKRLADEGQLTPEDAAAHRALYIDARGKVKRLTGARKNELGGVVKDLEGMAARGSFEQPVADPRAVPHPAPQRRVLEHAAAAALRRAAELPRLRARLPVLPRPRAADPVAGHLRQAQRLLERRQALRRPGQRAAGRGDAARHRARRRARVGVPVPVRQPGAAVGLLTGPGHGPAGDGALGHQAPAPGRDLPARAARARHLPDRAAAGRARGVRRRRALPAVLGRAAVLRPQRLRPVAGRPLRLRAADRRRDRARALRRGRPRRQARRSRPSTPAPGRCTRAGRSRRSPTSATTSSCATSWPSCASAPRPSSTAAPTSTSPST